MSSSDSHVELAVPSWIPNNPDDTMNLCGSLPPTGAEGLDASICMSQALEMMKSGQRFYQYFKSANGQQVRKNILLFYVEDSSNTASQYRSAGKLYWSERSRRSISQNRCLALDKITDIYLGAQTAVLKRAIESNNNPSMPQPNADLLFSLLSDTTMLDLEAHSNSGLCYWLWGLSVIMNAHDRAVNEKEADAADDALNLSGRSTGLDHSLDVTDHDLESLKREMLGEARRRHTRKFSVAASNITADSSFQQQYDDMHIMNSFNPSSMQLPNAIHGSSQVLSAGAIRSVGNQLAQPTQALKSSFTSLRDTVVNELKGMSTFIAQSSVHLTNRAMEQVELLANEQKKRRKLQNKLIELQGNIRVFARVRPLSDAEQAQGSCIDFPPTENTLSLNANGDVKQFEFDRVYAPSATQSDVFKDVAPFVQSAVDGYNICVFAYGQTGAGKSYTMEGPKQDPGVNTRAISELFNLIDDSSPSRTAGYTYEVTLSVVEIYNETLRDLLTLEKNKPKLDVRQGTDGVYVPDLTEIKVNSVEEVKNLMHNRAQPNRAVACTNMNEHSSRSHCCVFIRVTGTNGHEKTSGRLVLIDLAGSERLARSGAEGTAKLEAAAINSSLSALGNVIASLQAKSSHVPYRDSKLTYLLSNCLSGHSKCLMFVQLSPSLSSSQESSCSLQFAVRARQTDLGVAKKNKSSAVDIATLKRTIAEAEASRKKSKEESKNELAKLQAKLRAFEMSAAETQATIQSLQMSLKMAEKDRDGWKDKANTAVAAGATALHEQLRLSQKENAALKEKMAVEKAAGLTALHNKERELKDMRSKMATMSSSAGSSRGQAWEAEVFAPVQPTAPVAAVRRPVTAAPAPATRIVRGGVGVGGATSSTNTSMLFEAEIAAQDTSMAVDNEDQENATSGFTAQNKQPAAATKGGKKRRSGESVAITPSADEPCNKKAALDREDSVPFSSNISVIPAPRPRTAAAAASRIAAPLISVGGMNAASSNGATTTRASRVTRGTAAVAPILASPRGVTKVAAAVEPISYEPDEFSTKLSDPIQMASGQPMTQFMKDQMARIQERKLKREEAKAERATTKSKGWKM